MCVYFTVWLSVLKGNSVEGNDCLLALLECNIIPMVYFSFDSLNEKQECFYIGQDTVESSVLILWFGNTMTFPCY